MSWQSTMIPGFGPDGKPIVSVIAKRTYEIAQDNVFLANEQMPLTIAELPFNPADPYYSEILAESDLAPYKPFTDIVILGKAYTPNGKKAYHLDCEVQVGPARKTIRVYGERKLESKLMRGLTFTDPVPFESMDIGYANAFGGRAKSKDGALFHYPPNHLGKGFNLKGGFEEYSEIAVPCVEDPQSPIEPNHLVCDKFDDWKNLPKPASFGWTRQSFYPRYTYAGIIPELPGALQAGYEISPSLSKVDFRFYQGASNGLCNHVLNGSEHVKLTYMDADHPVFEFDLPGEKPEISIKIDTDIRKFEPVLQTIVIFKDFGVMAMVWRGCISIPGAFDVISKMQSAITLD